MNRIVLAGLIGTLWHHGVVYANTAMAWVPASGILDSVNALQTDLGRGRTAAQSLSPLATAEILDSR